ncbi:MAG: hypothetical protein LBH19_02580 [Dysgonamonadaceae bacterium]|jgi:hypothetical protein|nr:hypothetical protein [Dysgonamonadaceae bacterium]
MEAIFFAISLPGCLLACPAAGQAGDNVMMATSKYYSAVSQSIINTPKTVRIFALKYPENHKNILKILITFANITG